MRSVYAGPSLNSQQYREIRRRLQYLETAMQSALVSGRLKLCPRVAAASNGWAKVQAQRNEDEDRDRRAWDMKMRSARCAGSAVIRPWYQGPFINSCGNTLGFNILSSEFPSI